MDLDKYLSDCQNKLNEIEKRQSEYFQNLENSIENTERKQESQFNGYATAYSTANFCPQCGSRLSQEARFCPICGTQLSDSTAETVSPTATTVTTTTDERAATNLPPCNIDLSMFNEGEFVYSYTSGGESKETRVVIAEGELYLDDAPLFIDEDNFRGCIDIDDLGVAIAKQTIDDNDDEVTMTFEHEITEVYYEITLDRNLNYLNDNDNTMSLSLCANAGISVISAEFYELDETDFNAIQEAMENGDTDEIYDVICGMDAECYEILNLHGNTDAEKLSYELHDCDGELVDDGEITIFESNVFSEAQDNNHTDSDKPHRYLLIRTDTMKRCYADYTVPGNFSVGGIRFMDASPIPDNKLYCEAFGDTITSLFNIRFAGSSCEMENCGDAGSWGDHSYYLYEWNEDEGRYMKACCNDDYEEA